LVLLSFTGQKTPASFIGYVAAQLNVYSTVNQLTNMNFTSYNLTAAGGFVLTSYNRIEERNPSGAVVRYVLLRNLRWSVTAGNSTGGYLHYITMTGANPLINLPNTLNQGESIAMTFIIAEVLGEVSFGSVKTIVHPKALESVLEINDWNYVNNANHLVFVCGVATGAAIGASAGTVTVSSGSGNNQVYAHFDGNVDISGSKRSAKVTAVKTADFNLVTDDVDIRASADAVYHGQFNLQVVEIAFPPGATKITYDPQIGSGTPIVDSAQTNILFVLLLAIIVLLI